MMVLSRGLPRKKALGRVPIGASPMIRSRHEIRTRTVIGVGRVPADDWRVRLSAKECTTVTSLSPSKRSASTVSQIDARDWTNRRATEQATRAAEARQVSGRRRFVDPTTCERDYSAAELEFMQAMQEYKKESGRMFPTWSEVLEVLENLGYGKPGSDAEQAPATTETATKPSKTKAAQVRGDSETKAAPVPALKGRVGARS
jgi:hypothetical protein